MMKPVEEKVVEKEPEKDEVVPEEKQAENDEKQTEPPKK